MRSENECRSGSLLYAIAMAANNREGVELKRLQEVLAEAAGVFTENTGRGE